MPDFPNFEKDSVNEAAGRRACKSDNLNAQHYISTDLVKYNHAINEFFIASEQKNFSRPIPAHPPLISLTPANEVPSLEDRRNALPDYLNALLVKVIKLMVDMFKETRTESEQNACIISWIHNTTEFLQCLNWRETYRSNRTDDIGANLQETLLDMLRPEQYEFTTMDDWAPGASWRWNQIGYVHKMRIVDAAKRECSRGNDPSPTFACRLSFHLSCLARGRIYLQAVGSTHKRAGMESLCLCAIQSVIAVHISSPDCPLAIVFIDFSRNNGIHILSFT